MKLIWLVALLGLISCVDDKKGSTDDGIRPDIERIVGEEDANGIKKICQALEKKMSDLGSSTSLPILTYAFSEKNCGEPNMSIPLDVSVAIASEFGTYVLKKQNGAYFEPFKYAETTYVGEMVEICRNANALRNPIRTSATNATFFSTTNLKASDCAADGVNHVCIKIDKAVLNASNTFSIVSTEWIKFKVKDGYTGHFTERKIDSKSRCGVNNLNYMATAILR